MPDITLTFPTPNPCDLATIPDTYYPRAAPRYRMWLWRQYLTALQVGIELGTGDINLITAEMTRRETARKESDQQELLYANP